jgi:hypothetical protein
MLKFIPEVKKIGENPKNFGNYQYNTNQKSELSCLHVLKVSE